MTEPVSTGVFLGQNVGSKVAVKLADDTLLSGDLVSFDENLNIVLANAEEVLKHGKVNSHKDLFVRGNSIRFVYPVQPE